MGRTPAIENVMVTGATGFVGRQVVRELLSRGLRPVCLVRSADSLIRQARRSGADPDRLVPVVGSLGNRPSLQRAAELSQAVIHLVGIIMARRLKGQTFRRVHTQGTRNVLSAVQKAGVRRFIHMSALGTVPDAATEYHRTKWGAEQHVRESGLDWTIFQPSLIHGPDGEFMRLMRQLVCARLPPVIPYFGNGRAKVQPVSVRDVAYCLVESLARNDHVGRTFPLGGPKAYSWIELYNTCRALIPAARHWKPLVPLPTGAAKLMAALSAPLMALAELLIPSVGRLRFDSGQVQMAQQDNICDHTVAERAFGIQMRSFEDELTLYADQIP